MVGAWPMGHRLEAGRLAQDLGVSITPVRDSLNRLVGERLVDLVPGIGFHVPHLTERGLRDLLDFNLLLLLKALGTRPQRNGPVVLDVMDEDYATRVQAVFTSISALVGNNEIEIAVQGIGARLHAVRLHEQSVLPDAATELGGIEEAVRTNRPAKFLAGLLGRYHAKRKREAARLLEAKRRGF